MVARVVRIENKKLPMKDATKGMQVIGLGDGAVRSELITSERKRKKENRREKEERGESVPFCFLCRCSTMGIIRRRRRV